MHPRRPLGGLSLCHHTPCHCSQSSTDAFVLHLITFCICTSTRGVHLGDQLLVEPRPPHVLDPQAMGSSSFAALRGGQHCQRSTTPWQLSQAAWNSFLRPAQTSSFVQRPGCLLASAAGRQALLTRSWSLPAAWL